MPNQLEVDNPFLETPTAPEDLGRDNPFLEAPNLQSPAPITPVAEEPPVAVAPVAPPAPPFLDNGANQEALDKAIYNVHSRGDLFGEAQRLHAQTGQDLLRGMDVTAPSIGPEQPRQPQPLATQNRFTSLGIDTAPQFQPIATPKPMADLAPPIEPPRPLDLRSDEEKIMEQTWNELGTLDKLASDINAFPRDFMSTVGTMALGSAVKHDNAAVAQAKRDAWMAKQFPGNKYFQGKAAKAQALLDRTPEQRMADIKKSAFGQISQKLKAEAEDIPMVRPPSVRRPLETTASGVGSIAATLLPSAVTGPGGALTFGNITEFGDAYEEELARQKEAGEPMNLDKANRKASLYSGIATPLEYAGGTGRLVRKWFGKAAEEEVKAMVKKRGGAAFYEFMEHRLKDVIAESGTEGIQQLAQDAIVHGEPNLAKAIQASVSAAGGTFALGVAGPGSQAAAFKISPKLEQRQKAKELSRIIDAAAEGQWDQKRINELAVDALRTRDRATRPEYFQGTIGTPPEFAGTVTQQPPPPEEEMNVAVAARTDKLADNLGGTFRTFTGFVGQLKRDPDGRLVLDNGTQLFDLNVGPDATVGDAGVESAADPRSKLQRSRELARQRRLMQGPPKPAPPYVEEPHPTAPTLQSLMDEFPVANTTEAQEHPIAAINHQVEEDGMPVMHPAHTEVVEAVVGLINTLEKKKKREVTDEEKTTLVNQVAPTRRIVNGYIARLEAAGAPPNIVGFYRVLVQKLDEMENRYLDQLTRPGQPNKEAGVTPPPTPSPVSPTGASPTGVPVAPGAPVTPVTTPVTKPPQAPPVGQLPELVEEKPVVEPKLRGPAGSYSERAFAWETEHGGDDILAWIKENYPMMSKARAKARGKDRFALVAAEYDDAPKLARIHHNLIYRGNSTPDQVAKAAYRAGKLKEDSVNALWAAIGKASQTRAAMREGALAEQEQLERDEAFYEATHPSSEMQEGEWQLNGQHLRPGDTFTVGDSTFTVKRIDDATGDIIIDDSGGQFGRRRIGANEEIRVTNPSDDLMDRVAESPDIGQEPTAEPTMPEPEPTPPETPKLRPGEKKTGELFQGADQPFNLATQEAEDVEKTQREKAEAERKAKEAEEAAKKAQMNLPELAPEPVAPKPGDLAIKLNISLKIWNEMSNFSSNQQREKYGASKADLIGAYAMEGPNAPLLESFRKQWGEASEGGEAGGAAPIPQPKGPAPKGPDVPEGNPPPAADEQLPDPAPAPSSAPVPPPIEGGTILTDDQSAALKKKLQDKLRKLKGGSLGGLPLGAVGSAPGTPLGAELPGMPKKTKKEKLADDIYNMAVMIGADYIQRGYHKYEDFEQKMLEDFGPIIKDHLKKIYENARITIETPGGAGVRGRSPGLQPGLLPPAERIITARKEVTPRADETILPDTLLRHLDEHQRQGAAAAVHSMNGVGGFLNADGTGAGKSRQALAVAQYYAMQGKKVVIISINSAFKPNWSNGKFGGSYKSDAEAMGVALKLAREGVVAPGQVGITTYDNLSDIKKHADENTVYIFDEAHALKNDSKRSRHAAAIFARAKQVLIMTATPADKPEHIYYLAPIGIMEGKPTEQQLKDLGMKIRVRETVVKTAQGYEKQRIVGWSRDPKVTDAERQKRFNELFDRMTKQGHMIKREISMKGGVDIKVLNLDLPQEAHDLQDEIVDFFVKGWGKKDASEFNAMQRAIVRGHMRRQQEPFKIANAVMLAQRELAAGRQVVIYAARVNESEVGINKTINMGGMTLKTRDVLMRSEGTAKSLRDALHDIGVHDIAEIHGNSDQSSLDAMADFQSGKKRVVIATVESGGTGINLDDTVGNRPRTIIMLTAPFGATENVQAIGRIWRLKTLSDANVYYLFGNTFIDQRNAAIVAEKMRTLGAVVSGQVSKMNVGSASDVAQENFEDFYEEPLGQDEAPEVGELPEMDWKPRTFGKGRVMYAAIVNSEEHPFWEWWYANGTTNNPLGLTVAPTADGKWIIWSEKPIDKTGRVAEPPVIEPEVTTGMPTGDDLSEDDLGKNVALPGAKLGEERGAAGPPLAPTPTGPAVPLTGSPVTPQTLPPKSQREIIRDLAKALKIPIQFGRIGRGRFAGFFKPFQRYIGLKKADDVPTAAHEIGHAIDDKFGIRGMVGLMPELDKLGGQGQSSWNPSGQGPRGTLDYKLGEGFAEFIRYWLTDPNKAKQEAPKTFAEFDKILAANVDMEKLLRKAQSDIMTWLYSPNALRFRSQISRNEDPLQQSYSVSHLTRDLINDLHFFQLFTEDANRTLETNPLIVNGARKTKLTPAEDINVLARNLRGVYGMAQNFLNQGVVDFNTKEIKLGTSLEDALKPVQASGRSMVDFGDWMIAARARELRSQGKETGFLDQDIDAVYNRDRNNKVFTDAFAAVGKWQDSLVQYAVDAGLIDADQADTWRKIHKNYVPFHRVFEVGADEAPAIGTLGGVGQGLNVGRPSSFRSVRGSTRQVVDPLESMVRNAFSIINASEKAAIQIAMSQMADLPEMGRWIRPVPRPIEKIRIELDKIKKQLEDAGADLSKIKDPDKLILSFWRGSPFTPKGENIIRIVKSGKPEFYQLDRDLFNTFNALDLEDYSKFFRFLAAPAKALRLGVISEVGFQLANIFQDQFSSAVISKYGLVPFEAMIKGIGAMINDPKLVAEWAAAGGRQSIEAAFFDRNQVSKYIRRKITKEMTAADRASIWLGSPLHALMWLSQHGEEATRIGEYKTAYEKLKKQGMPEGEARRLAAFEARDRQDFAKGGAKTKLLRYLAPFWNAALQSNVALYNALNFKKAPKRALRTLAQGFVWLTMPKLIEQAINWDDDDYWARPQWERDAFFLVPYGKSQSGHTKFLRFPVPWTAGLLFATSVGRVLQAWKEKNPAAALGFPKLFLKTITPNPVPPFVQIPAEVLAGKRGFDYYNWRDIVPEKVSKLPNGEQYTERTGAVAKFVGQKTGVSPMKIDHVIRKTFGGTGRLVTFQETPHGLIAGRFSTRPLEVTNEDTQKFYDALEVEEGKHALRQRDVSPDVKPPQKLKDLHEAERKMGELRKRISAAGKFKNENAKVALQEQLYQTAKQAVKKYNR